MRRNPIGLGIALFFLIGGIVALVTPYTRLLGLIWIVVALLLLALYASMGRRAERVEQQLRTGAASTATIGSMTDPAAGVAEPGTVPSLARRRSIGRFGIVSLGFLLPLGIAGMVAIPMLRDYDLPDFLDPSARFFNVYQGERVVPAVENLNEQVGEGTRLLTAEVFPSGITFTVIERDEARAYEYDVGGDFGSAHSVSVDPRGAFPLARLDGEAPERILEAMKEDSGLGGLIYSFGRLARDPFGSERVQWTVAAGTSKGQSVSYTATPAGELIEPAGGTSHTSG